MGIATLASSFMAINGMHQASATLFGAAAQQQALAYRVDPRLMVSGDYLTLSKMDKQLTLRQRVAAFMYELWQQIYERARLQELKELLMKERLKDAGALYV